MTALPILDHIYTKKNSRDLVILSAGHAGMALYVMLEKHEGRNAEELLEKHGIHPCLDPENGIHASAGSLGSAVLVAVGLAVADRSRDVYVVLSDGECAEGSVWEALAFAHKMRLTNLKVHVNINGYSAYEEVDMVYLWLRLKAFWWRTHVWFTKPPSVSFLQGLRAHYQVMTEEHKDEIVKYLNAEGIRGPLAQGDGERLSGLFDHGRSWIRSARQYISRLSGTVTERWSK
jgi:transketolase